MDFQLSGEAVITRQRKVDSKLNEYANKNRSAGLFNDVAIKVGNENFPANRLVLACYSHYFEKMFTIEMKERYEKTVVLNGVDVKSWKILFNFIYLGSIAINCENVVGILAAADYLQINNAKEFCFEFLESVISVDSCFAVLNIASMYNNACLQKKVYNFVSVNFVEISQTSGLESLTEEMFSSCVSNLNQTHVDDTMLYETLISWIKFNEDNRKHLLPKLLLHVDFTKISEEVLKQIVATETLVTGNLECANLVMKSLVEIMNKKNSIWPSSKIFSIGGDNTPSKVCLIYNPFNYIPNDYPDVSLKGLTEVCAVKIDDFVFCIGGKVDKHVSSAVWRLNVTDRSKWENMTPMLSERSRIGASVFGNYIVVTGGCDNSSNALKSVEVYDVLQDKWFPVSGLNNGRFDNAQVTCDGCVYTMGGTVDDNSSLSSVEKLHSINGKWQFVKPMFTPRDSFAAVSHKGKIYAIGGWRELKTVESYCPQSDQWTQVSSMHEGRHWHAACELQGKIYVVGGIGTHSIERFDPSLDLWSIIGKTDQDFIDHSLFTV